MRYLPRCLGCVLALTVVLFGCSQRLGLPDPDVASSTYNYVVQPGGEDPFPAVGCMSKLVGGMIGTGTLINDHTVLTAGHIAAENPELFIIGDQAYIVDSSITHPQYLPEAGKGVDLGLCFLSASVKGAKGLQVSPKLDLKRFDGVVVVGYSNGIKKVSKPTAFMYFGNTVEQSQCLSLTTCRTSIWHGDSGGPVLSVRDGQWEIFGVISHMFVVEDSFGPPIIADNEAQRVDQHVDWIKETVSRHDS